MNLRIGFIFRPTCYCMIFFFFEFQSSPYILNYSKLTKSAESGGTGNLDDSGKNLRSGQKLTKRLTWKLYL